MPMKLTTKSRIAEISSKGSQEKWLENGQWYKLDLFGYEGLSETVTSSLLEKTNVRDLGFEYVPYRMERLEVHRRTRNGCSSQNFLQPQDSIITLADLLLKGVGSDWQRQAGKQPNLSSRVRWIVEQVQRLTGLCRFGEYLTLLFEIDMLVANEDRHLNNIAVLRKEDSFDYCPIFDFGAGLLSNLRDYPMDIEPKQHLKMLRARPLETTFYRQVQASRILYGPQLKWNFTTLDLQKVLSESLQYYAERDITYIKDRVETCVMAQQKRLSID